MPDRASGELRFHTFLKLASEKHSITLCPFNLKAQIERIGESATDQYCNNLKSHGITVSSPDVFHELKNARFDIIFFEFYHPVKRYINYIKLLQPYAAIVVDSVDIHYNRLLSKSLLTSDPDDLAYALKIKHQELAAYQQGDLVVVVTDNDGNVLKGDCPGVETALLSNIHAIPDYQLPNPPYYKLLFVGSFKHEPNIDAVLYFCNEIFPLVLNSNPQYVLEIVGPDAPESIVSLSSSNIVIRGFVENIEECYRNTHISIAPLRYGGGIKGKVGEALSYGLPVVTTEFGVEGFGLTEGENVLVADSAADFARSIIELSQNHQLYEKLSINGFSFIKNHYSEDVTRKMIDVMMDKIMVIIEAKSNSRYKRQVLLSYPFFFIKSAIDRLVYFYDTYLAWRFDR